MGTPNEAYEMQDVEFDIQSAFSHDESEPERGRKHREKPLLNFEELTDRDRCHGITLCSALVLACCWIIAIITFPFLFMVYLKVIRQYEKGIKLRFGYIVGGKPIAGIHMVVPFVEKIVKVDTRLRMFDVPKQELLTKDSVTIMVDAVVYYKVEDAYRALFYVKDYEEATHMISQTIVRNVLGTQSLAGILKDRLIIIEIMKNLLDDATVPWGIKVHRLEIKDIRLPESMKFAMAAEAEAVRYAEAKRITTEGEKQCALDLTAAAENLNSTAIELRYLESLHTMNNANLTVFPFPKEMLSGLTFVSPEHRIRR